MATLGSRPAGDSVRFIVPPLYADNPMLDQTGRNFHNIKIVNRANEKVSVSFDSIRTGNITSMTFAFAAREVPVRISYHVTLNYATQRDYMGIPAVSATGGWIRGAHLFIVPYTSPGLIDIWRTSFDLEVFWDIADELVLLGDPQQVAFDNPYQLLFSMSAIIDRSEANTRILSQRTANGQAFRFVSIEPTISIDSDLARRIADDFAEIVGDLSASFGTIDNAPLTVILRGANKGGLEGMYAFTQLDPPHIDSLDVFNMVLAHELAHAWVGVRTGDVDMPWWKEGTATYLGYLIAKRNEVAALPPVIDELVTQNYSGRDEVKKYKLTDEYARVNLFEEGASFGKLIYMKGAQVNMLLDTRIMQATAGNSTLDEVIGPFVQQHEGGAFSWSEYREHIERESGADIGDIYHNFIDATGAVPLDTLKQAFNWMAKSGAWGIADTLP
ncbi:MAG: hypothetical protein GF398_04705 [Chitinivibrionales bacterium]|nr:hypothetical protein [Chitinivibrionales bacterium]